MIDDNAVYTWKQLLSYCNYTYGGDSRATAYVREQCDSEGGDSVPTMSTDVVMRLLHKLDIIDVEKEIESDLRQIMSSISKDARIKFDALLAKDKLKEYLE